MRRIATVMAFLALAGCVEPTGQRVEPQRDVARQVVNQIIISRFPPGSPVTPIATCVVENATTAELLSLIQANVTGITPETTQLVLGILQRPETINCVLSQGIALPG